MNVSCPECRSVFRLDPAKITSISMRARCSVCGGLIPVGAAVSWGDDLPAITPASSSALGSTPGGVKPVLTKSNQSPSATAWPPPMPRHEARTPAPQPRRAPAGAASTPAPAQPRAEAPVQPRHRTPPFSPRSSPAIPRDAAPPRAQDAGAAATATRGIQPGEPNPSSTLSMSFGAPLTPPSRTRIPEPASTPKGATPAFATSGSVSAAFSTPSTPAPPPAVVQRKPINPFLANDPNQKARRLARALVSDMVAYHPTRREEGLQGGTLKQLFRDEIKKSYEEYVEQVGREFAESTLHFQEALNDVLAGGRKIF